MSGYLEFSRGPAVFLFSSHQHSLLIFSTWCHFNYLFIHFMSSFISFTVWKNRLVLRRSGVKSCRLVGTGEDTLRQGCARVAHCVTARWRNFSHSCLPLRHYDVWFTCSDNREALKPCRQQTVYTNKRLEFATEQVGRLRYVTAVDGGLMRFPSVAWFAHPCTTCSPISEY